MVTVVRMWRPRPEKALAQEVRTDTLPRSSGAGETGVPGRVDHDLSQAETRVDGITEEWTLDSQPSVSIGPGDHDHALLPGVRRVSADSRALHAVPYQPFDAIRRGFGGFMLPHSHHHPSCCF